MQELEFRYDITRKEKEVAVSHIGNEQAKYHKMYQHTAQLEFSLDDK